MERTIGSYVVLGLMFGTVFGLLFGPVSGYPQLTVFGGALAGVFIGWFIAVAVVEQKPKNHEKYRCAKHLICLDTLSGKK